MELDLFELGWNELFQSELDHLKLFLRRSIMESKPLRRRDGEA
ncbi:MAG: hypothetical protein U9R75_02205 [Candidatus Thermoplasmatota archaeon]|nr:hypothetical protein [Candidatus Thermoplasmatota archaeon]